MELKNVLTHPQHFQKSHSADDTNICLSLDGLCSIGIVIQTSVAREASDLETAINNALERVGAYPAANHDTNVAELFQGLLIEIGDGLTDSGGEAFAQENRIVLDRRKMLNSLTEAETYLVSQGVLDQGDWTATMDKNSAERPGSCLEYNLVNELGHLITDPFEAEIPADTISPTRYGQTKPKESIAESFARLVFGLEVPAVTKDFIDERITSMRVEIRK